MRDPIPRTGSRRGSTTLTGRRGEFTDQEIGVTDPPDYTRCPELFEGARGIWTQNLVLDNVVIGRKS